MAVPVGTGIHQTPFRLESYSEQVVQPAVDIIVNMIDSDGLALVNGVELSLLQHVSPIEWDNIVLYGEYVLNRRLVRLTRSRP